MGIDRIYEILEYMPDKMRTMLSKVFDITHDNLEEIRIRIGRPLIIKASGMSYAVSEESLLTSDFASGYIVKYLDTKAIFNAICENSVYAYLEEIKQGFITIKGGHRVGFVGDGVASNEKMENFRHISSINIRIAHQVFGVSDMVMDKIIVDKNVINTIVIAPPGVGKTTWLRDIARNISNAKFATAIADDRGELAAMYKGVPQNDIGLETDVMFGVPKPLAMVMMLRSMSPMVMISDEISTSDDVAAVLSVVGTGVNLIASSHGETLKDIMERNILQPLFTQKVFKQALILSRKEDKTVTCQMVPIL
ncbi:MAG: stage III sporulation protein AA [Oscillospiraceae bacterium]